MGWHGLSGCVVVVVEKFKSSVSTVWKKHKRRTTIIIGKKKSKNNFKLTFTKH